MGTCNFAIKPSRSQRNLIFLEKKHRIQNAEDRNYQTLRAQPCFGCYSWQKKRPAVRKSPKNFGHISRRKICKIQKIVNISPLTRKWPRFSARTKSEGLVWPNSSQDT